MRLFGFGSILILGAGLGSLVFTFFFQQLPLTAETLPINLDTKGIPIYTSELFRYALAQLPADALSLFARNHLIVLATGAGVIVLFFLAQLARVFGGRNRNAF